MMVFFFPSDLFCKTSSFFLTLIKHSSFSPNPFFKCELNYFSSILYYYFCIYYVPHINASLKSLYINVYLPPCWSLAFLPLMLKESEVSSYILLSLFQEVNILKVVKPFNIFFPRSLPLFSSQNFSVSIMKFCLKHLN